MAECRIEATRDGYVTSRNFEPGEVVMPGSRVLTMVDIGEVRATFYLPNAERDVARPGREDWSSVATVARPKPTGPIPSTPSPINKA